MNVTLKQLKVFLTVAQKCNLTHAAGLLYMTKGAISQNLAELESQLNTRLFDRRNSKLYLNSEGLKLIPLADELIRRAQYLTDEFTNSSFFPAIKIGCTKTIGCFILPNLLEKIKKEVGLLPEIIIGNSGEINDMLNKFEIDIALIEGPSTDKSLYHQFWMKDEMVIVASKKNPLVKKNIVSYERLNEENWILREPNSASHDFFYHQLALKLKSPKVPLLLNSFDAILLCVYNQLGLTFISNRCLSIPFYSENLIKLNVEDSFERNLNIIYQKNKYLSKNILNLIDFLIKVNVDE